MKAQVIRIDQGFIVAVKDNLELEIPYFYTLLYNRVIASTFKNDFPAIVIVLNNSLVCRKDIGEKRYSELLYNLELKGSVNVNYLFDMAIIDYDNPEREFTESELKKIILSSVTQHLWTENPVLMIERNVLDFVHNDILMRFSAKQVLKFIIYCLAGLALIQLLS